MRWASLSGLRGSCSTTIATPFVRQALARIPNAHRCGRYIRSIQSKSVHQTTWMNAGTARTRQNGNCCNRRTLDGSRTLARRTIATCSGGGETLVEDGRSIGLRAEVPKPMGELPRKNQALRWMEDLAVSMFLTTTTTETW